MKQMHLNLAAGQSRPLPRPVALRLLPQAKPDNAAERAPRDPAPARLTGFRLKRTAWRDLSFSRFLLGGRLADTGRLGRYSLIVGVGLAVAWLPAIGYMTLAPKKFTSHFSLILPGAGSTASVNLADIGQASSAAASAYSSPTISPTVTYKNLIMSANVVGDAEKLLNAAPDSLPDPVVTLVDETGFITVDITGASPAQARDRAAAVMNAFFTELNKLRDDEIRRREGSTTDTVNNYEHAVDAVRNKISKLQISSGLNSIEQYNALVTSTEELQTKVAETEATLAKDDQAIASLSANLHISPELAASTLKLHADPQFSALADATAKEQANYAGLSRQFGARHPKVVDARSLYEGDQRMMLARAAAVTGLSVKQLTRVIDLSPNGQRSGLLSQLVSLQTERDGLAGQLAAMRSELVASRKRVTSLVEVAATLDGLNRDYKVAEAVFASSLARVNTSKTDIFASYPMVQVTEPPIMPLRASSPNKKIAAAAAIASTLLLLITLGLAWVRRPLISRLLVRTTEQSGPQA